MRNDCRKDLHREVVLAARRLGAAKRTNPFWLDHQGPQQNLDAAREALAFHLTPPAAPRETP